jgi:hypothetical protein
VGGVQPLRDLGRLVLDRILLSVHRVDDASRTGRLSLESEAAARR